MNIPIVNRNVPQLNRSIKSGGAALNQNNESLLNLYALDHVGFDDPDGQIRGKHKKLSLVAPLETVPVPQKGEGVVFTDVLKNDDPLPQPCFIGEDQFVRTLWAVSEDRGDCSTKTQGFLKFPQRLMLVWGTGTVAPNTPSSYMVVPYPKTFKTLLSLQVNFIKSVNASKGITDVWVCTTAAHNFGLRNSDSYIYTFQYMALGSY
ncbi:MAG: hypothetical protein RR927_04955 [Victivallaceae bacterium]